MKKIFIVGCSRSGTSFIQQTLIQNFELWTLPETSYYLRKNDTFLHRCSKLIDLHVKAFAKKKLTRTKFILNNILTKELYVMLFSSLSYSRTNTYFEQFLNNCSLQYNKSGWLEKSSLHFKYISEILNDFENIKIIFVIRNGIDVVSSIRDRANKNKSIFGEQNDIMYSVDLWNHSIEQALAFKDNPSVLMLSFDDYLENTANQMHRLEHFLQLKSKKTTLDDNIRITENIETWKENLKDKNYQPKSKFNSVFTKNEQALIEARLDVAAYNRLFNK